jgi:phosphonate transport system permease protein
VIVDRRIALAAAAAPALPASDPALPGRLGSIAATFFTVAVLAWASEFAPLQLFERRSLEATARFAASFFPPAHSLDFLQLILRETWRTIAIATCGICLALALALPMALAATAVLSVSSLSGRMGRGAAMGRQAVRGAMAVLRTVPELVWALVFVRVSGIGLGPTAGVLAIALTYAGMLGKVYAEILESCDHRATRTLLVNGAGRRQAFLYGLLPQAAGELTSYTVYRWECAIRSSVVLGFVGAGGLGQQIDSSIKALAGGEVATMLLVFFALVAFADHVSARLREGLR